MPPPLRNQLMAAASPVLRRKLLLANAPQQVVALRSDGRQAVPRDSTATASSKRSWSISGTTTSTSSWTRARTASWCRPMSATRSVRTCSASSAICSKPPPRVRRCCSIWTTGRASRPTWRAGAQARKQPAARGLNENYARELMELHTLGVDGGYTQKDVIEVARCFTGWTIQQSAAGRRLLLTTTACTTRARRSCWA